MDFSSTVPESKLLERDFRKFANDLFATFIHNSVSDPSVFDYVVFVGVIYSIDDECFKVILLTVNGDVAIKSTDFYQEYSRVRGDK